MEIEDAKATHADGIARVARASLLESYSHFVDEETIEEVVEEWYSPDAVEALLNETDTRLQVATEDDEVVGFAQGALVGSKPPVGEIHWLHVDPAERGEEIGVQLLGAMEGVFETDGAELVRGLVLSGNEAGPAFYEDHGFDQVDSRSVEVAGEEYEELAFEKAIAEEVPAQIVQAVAGPEGLSLHVNFSDAERGVKGPFYPAFSDEELSDRYGWFCGNCETVDNAMDSMGRIECNTCGNKRKATRWDASYL